MQQRPFGAAKAVWGRRAFHSHAERDPGRRTPQHARPGGAQCRRQTGRGGRARPRCADCGRRARGAGPRLPAPPSTVTLLSSDRAPSPPPTPPARFKGPTRPGGRMSPCAECRSFISRAAAAFAGRRCAGHLPDPRRPAAPAGPPRLPAHGQLLRRPGGRGGVPAAAVPAVQRRGGAVPAGQGAAARGGGAGRRGAERRRGGAGVRRACRWRPPVAHDGRLLKAGLLLLCGGLAVVTTRRHLFPLRRDYYTKVHWLASR